MLSTKKIRFITLMAILTAFCLVPFNAIAEEGAMPLEHEAGFYYTVQKGDTLWDLSNQFFDSAWQWPELWQENNQIPNPHWIYPGNRIRLFNKKWTESTIAVPETGEAPFFLYKPINAVGFIREEPVEPDGHIYFVDDDKFLVGQGDIIYIKPSPGATFAVGKKYIIYEKPPQVKMKDAKEIAGYQHYFTGIAEVTSVEVVETSPGEYKTYAIAKVTKAIRTIENGDLVMPFKERSAKIPIVESVKWLEGEFIIEEDHRNYFGDGNIAFINKGKKDGIKVGQQYSIFYQNKKAIPGTNNTVNLAAMDYGSIIVLHTEETTATVLVTQADKSVMPGTVIRTPVAMAK
ncbi:MAG: LysM peptidoglycan-binding domain-containing protein [Desulfobacterales bacterium]|nr:LysM peptidoglycan-binding domain-containing protein [Desulfobacterales bacterium]